jgi:hypothetical protein
MPSNISQWIIDRYSAGPSESKVTQVANLQTTLRDVLGQDDYDTFLQGSYRNGTAIADINDVDIVARRKATNAPLSSSQWDSLFNTIASKLRNSHRVSGTVSIGDKCVKLRGASLNADIVPAVAIGDFTKDPIAIWSRREREERRNYPRTHYDNGVRKHRATSQTFKPTVRLFKRWARQYLGFDKTAPSFYIECAVHAVSSTKFSTYLPLSFAEVGLEIFRWSRNTVIKSVAGDKDILVSDEWHPDKFEAFQAKLWPDLQFVVRAMQASTTQEANRLWKLAFGDA